MPDDALGVAKRDAKGSFLGIVGSQCGEHRTVGDYRAWCHACGTWCYPGDPCYGCAEPITSARIESLTAENLALKAMREAAETVVQRILAERDSVRSDLTQLREAVTALADAWDHSLYDCPCHRGCSAAIRALLDGAE